MIAFHAFSSEREALLGRGEDRVCGSAWQLRLVALCEPTPPVEGGHPGGPAAGGSLGLPGPGRASRQGRPPGGPLRLRGAARLRAALWTEDERGRGRFHFRGFLALHLRLDAAGQRPVLLQPAPPLLWPAREAHLQTHRGACGPLQPNHSAQNFTERRA